jgi:hypothetical protein
VIFPKTWPDVIVKWGGFHRCGNSGTPEPIRAWLNLVSPATRILEGIIEKNGEPGRNKGRVYGRYGYGRILEGYKD